MRLFTVLFLTVFSAQAFAEQDLSKSMNKLYFTSEIKTSLNQMKTDLNALKDRKRGIDKQIKDLEADKCNGAISQSKIDSCGNQVGAIKEKIKSLSKDSADLDDTLAVKEAEFDRKLEAAEDEGDKKVNAEHGDTYSPEGRKITRANSRTWAEFFSMGMSAKSLLYGVVDQKARLNEFERNLDMSRLGLYTQMKMTKLLNDPVMCEIADQCVNKKRSAPAIDKSRLENVFTDIKEANRQTPAKATGAP